MKIEVVWRQIRHKRLKTTTEAMAFIKKLGEGVEEVVVYEVEGDTTTAYFDFGDDHTKPRKLKRIEMDG